MNYSAVYHCIIQHAKKKHRQKGGIVKYEGHHIIPRSLGGNNANSNIVLLTMREHYIAHKLLARMYTGDNQKKMIYALWWMSKTKQRLGEHSIRVTSRDYEYARTMYALHHPNKDPARKVIVHEKRLNGEYNHDNAATGRSLSSALKALSVEDMQKRMLNSTMTCNHAERVEAIKRGKSSLLKVTNKDGESYEIHSFQSHELLGFDWGQVKYRLKAHDGVLLDGRVVAYITKYTGGNKWKNKQ